MSAPNPRLLLRNYQSPGDTLMLTAAVRNLRLSGVWPGEVYVSTPDSDLWKGNPDINGFIPRDWIGQIPTFFDKIIDCEYPLIHESNTAGKHFVYGFTEHLAGVLGKDIPVVQKRGVICLSDIEKSTRPAMLPDKYWVMVAGGKYDYTAKWWPQSHWNEVVSLCPNITFVTVGDSSHFHPGVIGVEVDLIGKTSLRGLLLVLYHSLGVICPVTFAHHAIASLSEHNHSLGLVTLGGGREPTVWIKYENVPGLLHKYFGPVECYPCSNGVSEHQGCWKSRTIQLFDGDEKDQSLCNLPVLMNDGNFSPKCMIDIRPEMVSVELAKTNALLESNYQSRKMY